MSADETGTPHQPRAEVVVYYDDQREERFNPNRPRHLLDMEKRFGVQQPETHEQVFWLAHHVVAPDVPFDQWVDTVADVDTIERDGGAQQGEGSSSTG
jgi:hypothetical protein